MNIARGITSLILNSHVLESVVGIKNRGEKAGIPIGKDAGGGGAAIDDHGGLHFGCAHGDEFDQVAQRSAFIGIAHVFDHAGKLGKQTAGFGILGFLAHGDGVGRHAWSFALIRGIFRNEFCQWLFAAVHPRWTIPFAHRWSSHSRRSDGMQPSEKAIATVEQFTTKYATEHPEIDYFVYGHLHILRNEPVGANSRMVVLGDWISLNSWAEFDGKELVLKQNV